MSVGLLDSLVSLIPRAPVKAATGIGSQWMTYDLPLSAVNRSAQKMYADAQGIYLSNRHIRRCERVISSRFGTVPYHLETGDDEEIGDDSPPILKAVLDLMERPYTPRLGDPRSATPRTRADLWSLTSRHMGICGPAYWYLNETELLAGTPLEILYINPARMWPVMNDNGDLIDWAIDAEGSNPVKLGLKNVIQFNLEPPDKGHLSTGLVASAMPLVDMTRLADRYASGVLSSGGRLSGVFAPPSGDVIPEEQYKQLQLDLRNIAESPDAAKRMVVLRGPVEFTKTSATPSELDLLALMSLSWEEISELWGVPASQQGGSSGAGGLNSGASKGFDEAVLWQNAVGPRLRTFGETVQYELLDRWKDLIPPVFVELELEEPEFDDDTPMYTEAKLAAEAGIPLTQKERREKVGLDPFPEGDPRNDEVWMISTFVRVYPEAEPAPIPPLLLPFTGQTDPMMQAPAVDAALPVPEPTVSQQDKARVPGIDAVREKQTAAMTAALTAFLAAYGAKVAGKVSARAAHLAKKPTDDAAWWNESEFVAGLTHALTPHVTTIAHQTSGKVDARFSTGKASLDAVLPRLLKTLGIRIRGISETTRERVRGLIADGINRGLGAAELGALIRDEGPFNELRAETIARTETATALNNAALESYREFDITHVQAADGDEDAVCAARDGKVYTIEAAAEIEDHPNGTLSWTPIVGAPA